MAAKRKTAAPPAGRPGGDPRRDLTLEELALVVDGLVETLSDDATKRLGQVLRTDPRFEAEIAELEGLAREAALGSEDTREYLSVAQAVDRALTLLLDADGWKHPAEVLDPDGTRGIPYAPMIRLARERERTSEDPEKIRGVRQRLEEALAAETAEDALVEGFVARLLELPPARAIRLIARAARHYEQQLDQRRLSAAERRRRNDD